jgi:hypothetical protein
MTEWKDYLEWERHAEGNKPIHDKLLSGCPLNQTDRICSECQELNNCELRLGE